MNQNKGITITIHNVHKIIIELFSQNAGVDFPPPPPQLHFYSSDEYK